MKKLLIAFIVCGSFQTFASDSVSCSRLKEIVKSQKTIYAPATGYNCSLDYGNYEPGEATCKDLKQEAFAATFALQRLESEIELICR